MVFITAGMGGGTGTGAGPIVAEVAKDLGILTVGVVTKPFSFEGNRRMKMSEEGIDELSKHVHSLIVVLNENLYELMDEDATQADCFKAADDVLHNACAGIAEIINVEGNVNVDFQDVKTIMGEQGQAMMGTAIASGPDRARIAAEQAVLATESIDQRQQLGGDGGLVLIGYKMLTPGRVLLGCRSAHSALIDTGAQVAMPLLANIATCVTSAFSLH
jgi:cell division protein FtsZ